MSRLATALVLLLAATACTRDLVRGDPPASASLAATPEASSSVGPSAPAGPRDLGKGRTEQGSFHSSALDRTLKYLVYLSPA